MARGGNDLKLGRLTGNGPMGTKGGAGPPVWMRGKDREGHMYVAGSTGTGKSKFLENLIQRDILEWRDRECGLLLLDPHGKLYDDLIKWCAAEKLKRPIIPIDLRRNGWVIGYNILRNRPGADPAVVVDQIVEAIGHVWGQSEFSETPLLREWLGNTIRTLYENGLSLLEALVFLDPNAKAARAEYLEKVNDPAIKSAWQALEERSSSDFQDKIQSTRLRLRRFLDCEILKLMLAQDEATLDMGEALEEGHIILVSLSPEGNQVSTEAATLFGRLILSDLWSAALARGKRDNVKPFYVYLDEFQRFITPTLGENLDEARGYGIHFTLANQFPGQLTNAGEVGNRVYKSIAENSRNKVAFHLADPENLEPLAQIMFRNTFNPDEIKHRLHSRKVMDYMEELRSVESHTESESEGETETDTTSSGEMLPPHAEEPALTETTGSSTGITKSRGTAKTESEQIVQKPVFGSELSSVQFRPLDEQLERAIATLHDQKQRHCIVKLRTMDKPASLLVPTVPDNEMTTSRQIARYIRRRVEQCGCGVSEEQAKERLKEREEGIRQAIQDGHGKKQKHGRAKEEPSGSKRTIRGKPRARGNNGE